MPDVDKFGSEYVLSRLERNVDDIKTQLSGLAGKSEVAFLSARMDSMVPRSEHEVHWKRDDERMARIDGRLDKIESTLEKHNDNLNDKIEAITTALTSNRLPRWFLPLLGIIVPILTVLAVHVWR